jgi:hypothetical protein
VPRPACRAPRAAPRVPRRAPRATPSQQGDWPAPAPVPVSFGSITVSPTRAYAAAAALRATPTRPAPELVPQPGGVQPFCPAAVVMDCSATEAKAAEQCMWAHGFQGAGLPLAAIHMFIVWCSWHLFMAWCRNLDEKVPNNPQVKKRLKEALSALLGDGSVVTVSPRASKPY